jgi:hypothetical protein
VNVPAHRAHFAARERSAALPPAHDPLVAFYAARLRRTSDPTIRACLEKLLESARRGPRVPRPSRLPEIAPSAHGLEGDYREALS